jgi:hypothetical protein
MKVKYASLLLLTFCFINAAQSQGILNKIKNKVNKTAGTDKPETETEKKENAASNEYSDATENNEKPIFVDAAPANGKMILKLKKGDRFWGGHISLTGQPKKNDVNANVLDFVTARVGSFYTAGEMSSYAIYFDGQRFLNDASDIPLRPTFIGYDVNKTPFLISTEAKVGTPNPTAAVAAAQAKGNKPLTKEDEAEFAKLMGGQITPATFTFKYNGKTYGPFNGLGENIFILKSMTNGKPTEKFYGFGAESYIGEKEGGFQGLVQTERKVLRIKDYMLTTLAPTYPAGTMAFALGGKVNSFSNGKTVAIKKIAGIADGLMNLFTADNKYYSEIYGTDSGHVVSIVKLKDITQAENTTEAWVDYTTKLTYPVNITKQHLLLATNPAKSALYNKHTLYYADGTKETINNVGDAQLVNFNGKNYIVWFEMMKVADGHEIYVCQKELK